MGGAKLKVKKQELEVHFVSSHDFGVIIINFNKLTMSSDSICCTGAHTS